MYNLCADASPGKVDGAGIFNSQSLQHQDRRVRAVYLFFVRFAVFIIRLSNTLPAGRNIRTTKLTNKHCQVSSHVNIIKERVN